MSNISFPANIIQPIKDFLAREALRLEKRKREISKEDPFRDMSRLNDNASPDDDADEQFGHERVAAIQKQLDRKLIQVKKAIGRIKVGKYGICESCGKMIDTDRLTIMPEATLCVDCENRKEK